MLYLTRASGHSNHQERMVKTYHDLSFHKTFQMLFILLGNLFLCLPSITEETEAKRKISLSFQLPIPQIYLLFLR